MVGETQLLEQLLVRHYKKKSALVSFPWFFWVFWVLCLLFPSCVLVFLCSSKACVFLNTCSASPSLAQPCSRCSFQPIGSLLALLCPLLILFTPSLHLHLIPLVSPVFSSNSVESPVVFARSCCSSFPVPVYIDLLFCNGSASLPSSVFWSTFFCSQHDTVHVFIPVLHPSLA